MSILIFESDTYPGETISGTALSKRKKEYGPVSLQVTADTPEDIKRLKLALQKANIKNKEYTLNIMDMF